MSTRLKIRSKSLTAEARFIRKEEYKVKSKDMDDNSYIYDYNPLRQYRTEDVRWEARAVHLVRAISEGVAYSKLEQKRKPEKEWEFNHSVLPIVYDIIEQYHIHLPVEYTEIRRNFLKRETMPEFSERRKRTNQSLRRAYVHEWLET